jgi:hypothetical protein
VVHGNGSYPLPVPDSFRQLVELIATERAAGHIPAGVSISINADEFACYIKQQKEKADKAMLREMFPMPRLDSEDLPF